MKIFDVYIAFQVSGFLCEKLNGLTLFETANEKMIEECGIVNFFEHQHEFDQFKRAIVLTFDNVAEPDRTEYGAYGHGTKRLRGGWSVVSRL